MAEGKEEGEVSDERKNMQFPLVMFSEIPPETETEIMDMICSAVDRYITDLPLAAKYIKEEMDRLYEPYWHCIVGENFGFDITYHSRQIMYVFYMGNLAILVWKCFTTYE